jgi:sulfur-carrier protein
MSEPAERISTHRAQRGDAASPDRHVVRVVLPAHLRVLGRVDGEVALVVEGPVTQRSVLDALEARHPALRGTIRDHATLRRRAFVRLFACERDLSHDAPDEPLPEAVACGAEPLRVVGAMAGG